MEWRRVVTTVPLRGYEWKVSIMIVTVVKEGIISPSLSIWRNWVWIDNWEVLLDYYNSWLCLQCYFHIIIWIVWIHNNCFLERIVCVICHFTQIICYDRMKRINLQLLPSFTSCEINTFSKKGSLANTHMNNMERVIKTFIIVFFMKELSEEWRRKGIVFRIANFNW